MSRETKFRAWIKPEKCYRSIMSIKYDIYGRPEGVWVYKVMVDGRGSNYFAIDEVELEQYSGFKDTNGKEICAGDIVRIAGQGNVAIEFPFIELYDAAMENDIEEILGNIHDNPELLEESE